MSVTINETELPDVGGKIWFEGERCGYTVQARDARFLVCTKPFNPRHTVLYTVIDLEEDIRGTENLSFGMGAETRSECEEMLDRLTAREIGECTAVSHRNRVPLRITRTRAAS